MTPTSAIRRATIWLAVAAASGAIACVSAPAGAEDVDTGGLATIAAAGGALELTVSAGALPNGVDVSDISITTIAAAEGVDVHSAGADSGAREIARFDLQPSGARFEEPVPVSVRLPLSAVTGPLLAHLVSEDGSLDLLPVSIAAIDGETVVATTAIEHFSEIVWSVIGFEEFSLMVEPDIFALEDPVLVGHDVDVQFRLTRLQGEQQAEFELIGRSTGGAPPITAFVPYTIDVGDGPWQLRGVFANRSEDVLSPMFDPVPPGEWTVSNSEEIWKDGAFSCREPGEWTLTFGGAIQLSYEAHPAGAGPEGVALPTFEAGNHIQVLTPLDLTGECVAPDEPPANATENIPPNVAPIDAVSSPPMTVYAISASDPERGTLTFSWSGTNCGTTFGDTSTLFAWDHGTDDCEHDTFDHPEVTIAVLVSDGVWQVSCSYQGAASGSGEACDAPTQVQ